MHKAKQFSSQNAIVYVGLSSDSLMMEAYESVDRDIDDGVTADAMHLGEIDFRLEQWADEERAELASLIAAAIMQKQSVHLRGVIRIANAIDVRESHQRGRTQGLDEGWRGASGLVRKHLESLPHSQTRDRDAVRAVAVLIEKATP